MSKVLTFDSTATTAQVTNFGSHVGQPIILLATTDRWYPTLRLALALKQAGCLVDAVCPSGHPFGLSEAVRGMYDYNGLAPVTSFARAIRTTKPDLVIPADDLATWHLHELHSRERNNGVSGTHTCELIERSLGSADSFPLVRARNAFMQLAKEEVIRAPQTAVIESKTDLLNWIAESGFPTVLKANGTSGGEGVKVVSSLHEAEIAFHKLQSPPLLARAVKRALIDRDLTLIWPSLMRQRPTVNAQVFVNGREATSAIVCWEGTILASVHFEVVQKVRATGHATVIRRIDHPEMMSAAEKIARRLKLSGFHGLDFMIEADTGNAHLIEINPRTTQVGHLALGPGRDLPAALYAAVTRQRVEPAPTITENDTIALFPQEWKRDPASPFLSSAYHDVPWSEPLLISSCLSKLPKHWTQEFKKTGTESSFVPGSHNCSSRKVAAFRLDCRAGVTRDMNSDIKLNRANGSHLKFVAPKNGGKASRFTSGDVDETDAAPLHRYAEAKRPLRVMKFGGTSVGDASCMARVVEIIRSASRNFDLAVVVSAMSGVTNKLVEAACQAEEGNADRVAEILKALREQHDVALKALIQSSEEQKRISLRMDVLFEETERLCKGTIFLRELTPRVRDGISSLGERLSVPLIAAALQEAGVVSEAIEATELIVTDSSHGAADPWLDLTLERCETRLRPLVRNGVVPIVTGFIGATSEGVLTTLGRGGSDYSATILGAVISADEVEIWTDVDGVLTADPRLVPTACTISEVSYREAAELAYFGAKVLHPKTLRPLAQSGIPLWIRNSFAPEKPGTKITPGGATNNNGVTALTAVSDAALITVGGPGIAGVPDVLGRTFATTREIRADVLLISQSSSQNDICLVVPSAMAKRTVEDLRREFAQDLAYEQVEHITIDSSVSIITVVGKNIRGINGILGRTFCALGRANVDTIAIAHGASECNISLVVAKKDMQAALAATHREFGLGDPDSQSPAEQLLRHPSRGVDHDCEHCSATAD